jgi:hypothetical protein
MTAQNPDDALRLVLLNDLGNHISQSLRLMVRRRDMEVVEPVLQRLIRSGMNEGFSFRLEEVMQKE